MSPHWDMRKMGDFLFFLLLCTACIGTEDIWPKILQVASYPNLIEGFPKQRIITDTFIKDFYQSATQLHSHQKIEMRSFSYCHHNYGKGPVPAVHKKTCLTKHLCFTASLGLHNNEHPCFDAKHDILCTQLVVFQAQKSRISGHFCHVLLLVQGGLLLSYPELAGYHHSPAFLVITTGFRTCF